MMILLLKLCFLSILFRLITSNNEFSIFEVEEGHRCVHDEIVENSERRGYSATLNENVRYNTRDSRAITYENIRIHVDTSGVQAEQPSKLSFYTKIVNLAVEKLSLSLKVNPVVGNLKPVGIECWTGSNFFQFPLAHRTVGVPNTDFIIYVDASSSGSCGSSTIAFAITCERDGIDRPVIGYTNICQLDVSKEGISYYESKYASILAHEMFHALGFSKTSFDCNPNCLFRDPNNSFARLTPSEVTNTFIERGKSTKKIVTPKAKEKAQEHFSCSSLNGVEIEEGGGLGTEGSHLEMRLYPEEFMAGVSSNNPKFSSISFAIMEDSGWYQVDYSSLDDLVFGENAGCEFAYLSKCLDPGLSPAIPDFVPPYHYCKEAYNENSPNYFEADWKCTPDLKGRGYCGIGIYTNNLPSWGQYWTSNPKKGGAPETTDYCPYYRCISMKDLSNNVFDFSCNNPEGSITQIVGTKAVYGETVGKDNCRCMMSNLLEYGHNSEFVDWKTQKRGVCFEFECGEDHVKVWAKDSQGRRAARKCSGNDHGVEKSMNGYSGTFVCPTLIEMKRMCPQAEIIDEGYREGQKGSNGMLSGLEAFGVTFGVLGVTSFLIICFCCFFCLFLLCGMGILGMGITGGLAFLLAGWTGLSHGTIIADSLKASPDQIVKNSKKQEKEKELHSNNHISEDEEDQEDQEDPNSSLAVPLSPSSNPIDPSAVELSFPVSNHHLQQKVKKGVLRRLSSGKKKKTNKDRKNSGKKDSSFYSKLMSEKKKQNFDEN